MNSIGLHLEKWIKQELISFHAIIPNSTGLAAYLADIRKLTNEFQPSVVIIDPITNLRTAGHVDEIQDLITFFKSKQITTMFTSLITGEGVMAPKSDEGIASLMDTWVDLQYIYGEGERNRGISILKSRGMAHSNQLREVIISEKGINLQDVYIGSDKVLAGSARLVQASKLEIENSKRESELQQKERKLEITRKTLEGKIQSLHEMLADAKEEEMYLNRQKEHIYNLVEESRAEISKIRMADIALPKLKEIHNGKSKKASKKEHN